MKYLVLALLCLLTLPTPMTASDASKQAIKDSIEKAQSKANIFALSSFEMKAKVRIISEGKLLEGSYVLYWNGPEQWREEISVPGYREIEIGGKGIVFLKRSTDFLPLPIYRLHSSLGYGSLGIGSGVPRSSLVYAAVGPNETVKKVHGEMIHGLRVECAEVEDQHDFKRNICVDSSTGTLV